MEINKSRKIYSKKAFIIIRILSVLSIILLTIACFSIIIKGSDFHNQEKVFSDYESIALNIICIACFFILILFPEKYILISIMSFIYAITIFIDEPNNQMGPLMILLCYYTLHIRNFFHKNKLIKILIISIICIASFLTQLRFGFNAFLNSFFTSSAFFFVIFLILFFFKEKNRIEITSTLSDKKLNLHQFQGTRKEDVQLLTLVLQKKQYLEISQIVSRSEGTIRNRLNKLYDILEVADRIGFVTTYAGYEITYEIDNQFKDYIVPSMKK